MAAVVSGAVVLEVSAAELPRLEALMRERPPSGRLKRARMALHGDGRASYELPTLGREALCVVAAVLAGVVVSVGCSLGLGWLAIPSLPAGLAVGLTVGALCIARDRLRLHREARAYLRALR